MAQKPTKQLVKQNNARHAFMTPIVQLSFPKIFTPVLNTLSDKMELSADLIYQSEDDLKAPYKGKKLQTVSLRQAVHNVRVDQWGPKEKWPKWTFDSIKDGDNQTNKDGEIYAGYEGKKFITGKSIQQKGKEIIPIKIVGLDGKPLEEKDIWGGCMVRALVVARPVDFGKTIGVRFMLQQIMKVEDGERFGGGGSQADVFDVEEESEDDSFDAMDEVDSDDEW